MHGMVMAREEGGVETDEQDTEKINNKADDHRNGHQNQCAEPTALADAGRQQRK